MKPLPWFYAPDLDARPESAVLVADESKHLARSRRLRIGGEIIVFDGLGTTAKAKSWISVSGELRLRLS